MTKKLIVGLTGGIATGKSTVLNEFKRLGARVLDCDKISRDLVRPKQPALKKIAAHFGKAILKKDGSLDRPALGNIVFANPKQRKKLENILHPEVAKAVKKATDRISQGLIVVDIPLLFEVRWQNKVDKILVVWTPATVQIQRVMKRDKVARGTALAKIQAQWPIDRKKKRADFVIDNSGSKKQAILAVKALFKRFSDDLLTK